MLLFGFMYVGCFGFVNLVIDNFVHIVDIGFFIDSVGFSFYEWALVIYKLL